MLINAVIINVDTTPLEEIFYEMHKISVYINQNTKVENTNGKISPKELDNL